MPVYDIYPAVDSSYNFPPEIRAAMALYPELLSKFAGKSLETTVGSHTANAANPHNTTKAQVGLGNVDNTADTAKPVSAAQQNALNLKANLASPTFTGTVGGITKAMVGLSNVDNTSDANKPLPTSMLNLSKGLVAYAEATTNSGTSTGLQVAINIPSFTFLAERWYEVEWSTAAINMTGASTVPMVNIFSCSTSDLATSTSGLTELMGANLLYTGAAQTVRADPKRKIKFATNTTLQIKGTINGNGQSCYIGAGPTWPSQLTIMDLGDQI